MLNFPNGKLNNGGNIRNVLDVGCGVASFGAYLLSHDILAMSLAPNDVHENQIQFALERGIPATLGVLGTRRLPYPSRSFEMAHCSRCRIDWLQRDGVLLLEVDRVLRPGGYFVG
jgi:SAM-dependent methyltransferase